MTKKRDIINTLFLLALPFNGFASRLVVQKGFTTGLLMCSLPYVLIVLFHAVDLLHKGRFTLRVNRTFWVCMAFITSAVISVYVGYRFHSPYLSNPVSVPAIMMLFTMPFLAGVVVQVYNLDNDDFDMGWMLMKSMLLLVVINLLGYAAGLHNLLHSFEGRISLPFFMGIYDSAHVLAVVNLMLLFYIRDLQRDPLRWFLLVLVYAVNLGVMMSVNSRLSIMIFFLFTVLFATKAIRGFKGMYTVSLFTMPLMMSFALLIYQILSLPVFAAILGRVSKEDVTTFNGRTYIWEDAATWATEDRRGMLFGNGYNGQQHIHLLDHVARLWGEEHPANLHMHSSFLEILVNQGVVGLVLMYMVYWAGYKFYRAEYSARTKLAPMFAGFAYLLFIWQIDIFSYGIYMGYPLLCLFMAPVAIGAHHITRKRRLLDGTVLS